MNLFVRLEKFKVSVRETNLWNTLFVCANCSNLPFCAVTSLKRGTAPQSAEGFGIAQTIKFVSILLCQTACVPDGAVLIGGGGNCT